MFRGFQRFVRGFIVDPQLEKHAHSLVIDAQKTVTSAQSTLNKVNSMQTFIILAGVGLLVAGFVAGRMSAKNAEQEA